MVRGVNFASRHSTVSTLRLFFNGRLAVQTTTQLAAAMPPAKRVIGFTVLDKDRKKRYTRLAKDLGADVVDETVGPAPACQPAPAPPSPRRAARGPARGLPAWFAVWFEGSALRVGERVNR